MPRTITTLLSALICITLAPLIASAAPYKGTASAGDKEAGRGKQLVIEGNCDYCHTPLIETKEGPAPDMKRRLSGHPQDREIPRIPDTEVGSPEWIEFLGTLDTTEWAGPWGLVFSKNITPDPETGIGKWTEEIFVGTMRSGKHIDLKRDIMPPMPWQDYAKLSDEDLKSIFAYLMTLPPVKNAVPKPVPMPGKKSGE
jgi:cytochrome c553